MNFMGFIYIILNSIRIPLKKSFHIQAELKLFEAKHIMHTE